jgi:hypothetical protein
MNLIVVVVAGVLLPFLATASPLYSQDADDYGTQRYFGDPYPGGYRGAGGHGGVDENRYAGSDDHPSAPGGWGRNRGDYYRDKWRDHWQQEDGGGPQRPDSSLVWPEPWSSAPASRDRNQGQGSGDNWYPSRAPDPFEQDRYEFPKARSESAEPYGYDRRGSGPDAESRRRWPDAPPRPGAWPSDRASYRYRGDGDGANWWRGYRFRPLSDSELQRMRPEQVPPPRWGSAGAAPPPRGQGDRGHEVFGYEPDGWFRRYYGEQP